MELGEIPEIQEGTNADDKLWTDGICDQSKDIPLDISVYTAGHMFQARDP